MPPKVVIANSKPNVELWYALVASEADRLDAEQALYDKYQHRCNSSRLPGSGRSPRPPVEEE